jgi:hypothetical protein
VNYQHIDLRLGTNRNHCDADSGEFCLDLLFGQDPSTELQVELKACSDSVKKHLGMA